MKITLITICFNSGKTIKDTLESVLKQSYDNYEYIIKDGKSIDNTLDILKEYKKKFRGKLKIISSEDQGVYDAINKGIKKASGDIIGILNSDDILANNDSLKIIAQNFINNVDGVYSNLLIKDNKTMTKVIRKFIPKVGNYKLGWYPPHPTLYLKKEVYEKYGMFDINYKIAADYDFMLRLLINKCNLKYINSDLVFMRNKGLSTNGIKGYMRSFNESLKVLKNNNIKYPYIVNIIRCIKIIFQFIHK